MRRQAWDHPVLADHVQVVRKPVHGALVLVDQLFGGAVMDQADLAPPLRAVADHLLRLGAVGRGIAHIDDGRIDLDHMLSRGVLSHADAVHQGILAAERGHHGINVIGEIGFHNLRKGFRRLKPVLDHAVLGHGPVAPAQEPVGAHDESWQ